MVIAIDGPAGAGKSSVARELARRLGYVLLDTGVLYRALAWAALEQGLSLENEAAIAALTSHLSLNLCQHTGQLDVLVAGRNVSASLRTPEISQAASVIAQFPLVRSALLPLQKSWAEQRSCVVEGRDIGTAVFPHADIKFFLTAREEVRSHRRFNELRARGMDVTPNQVLAQQHDRDRRDTLRATAPLKPATDAIVVDTSDLSLGEVVNQLQAFCEKNTSFQGKQHHAR